MSRNKAKSDRQIIQQMKSLEGNLTNDGLTEYLSTLTETKDFYKKKRYWSTQENLALRVFTGRIHPDELCEAFMCSYTSLTDQQMLLGLLDLSEGRLLEAQDVELFIKLLNSIDPDTKQPYTAKKLCYIYGLDYDKDYDYHTISPEIDEKLIKASEGDLFDD